MLGEKAFGNFRDLLEGVTYHPMMGVYLSHLKNQKEDPTTGRVPDLNFAREITQLFSIGQYKLNADGTRCMGADGQPATAYNSADLSGLSQVFTGLSWYAGPQLTDRTAARFRRRDAQPRARLAADAGVRRVHRRTPASTRSARRTSSAPRSRR